MKALRFVALLCLVYTAFAQAPAKKSVSGTAEQRTAKYFESIKGDPLALRQFLYNLPKGGDLHNHLSGAVYAESYVAWAAEDGWCVETATLNYVRPKTMAGGKPVCDAATQRPASDANDDPGFYTALIDAMSIRNWNPAQRSGQAQFFSTFMRFDMGLAGSRFGSAFAELRRRSAAQNLHYLELIVQLDQARALIEAPKKLQWKEAGGKPDFGAMHHQLAADGLFTEKRSSLLDKAEQLMDQELKCGLPKAGVKAEPGCAVPLRYQCQVLRAFPQESVFAQIAFCFELANSDPRVVTLNLVQPEDWLVPVRDYDLHMRMIDYFHAQFPKVKITLHAGELTLGQVPPGVLGYHIPTAIDTGHAQRIGHGTDVMYHPHAFDILREMALKKVAVEISPSSSKYILGLTGSRHPFRHYLKAGVPVVIATDDEGVARSDITNEYQQAVEQHGLTYAEVKKIALDSLEYGFLADADKAAAMVKLQAAFVAFEKGY